MNFPVLENRHRRATLSTTLDDFFILETVDSRICSFMKSGPQLSQFRKLEAKTFQ